MSTPDFLTAHVTYQLFAMSHLVILSSSVDDLQEE